MIHKVCVQLCDKTKTRPDIFFSVTTARLGAGGEKWMDGNTIYSKVSPVNCLKHNDIYNRI